MRADKKSPIKPEKKTTARSHKRGVVGYTKKTALLEEAITQMNAGKYGRSSAALKELLTLDPLNMEARRLFATLHLRLGSLIPARQAFESLINEAFERQDYWLAESLLREYLAAGPRCVPFLEKLGAVFQEKGDVLEAVAEYGKAIDILIEDPDLDNPQHAAQLYAKIRSLAPASPVAFRVAAFFDAQTGELIARPEPVQEETAAILPPSESSNEVTEATTIVSMGEPLPGVMPWEQVEELSSESSFPMPIAPDTVQNSPTSEPDTLHEVSPPQALTLHGTNTEPIPILPLVMGSSQVLPEASNADIQLSTATDSASGLAVADCSTDRGSLEALPAEQGSPVPLSFESPQHVPTKEEAVSEVISAPMPWEHVHETTICIPEHVSEESRTPLAHAETPVSTALQDTSLPPEQRSEPTDSTPPAPDEAVDWPVESESEQAPVTASTVSATIPAESILPDTSKGGRFSWESVMNRAWKFGDRLSSGTPVIETEKSHAVAHEAQNVVSNEVSDAAAVVEPMPWDQAQEAVATMELAESEVTSAPEAAADPLPLTGETITSEVQEAASYESQSHPAISSSVTTTDARSFSITLPPPAPPSAEPEFRLLSRDSVFSGEFLSEPAQVAQVTESRAREMLTEAQPGITTFSTLEEETTQKIEASPMSPDPGCELDRQQVESADVALTSEHTPSNIDEIEATASSETIQLASGPVAADGPFETTSPAPSLMREESLAVEEEQGSHVPPVETISDHEEHPSRAESPLIEVPVEAFSVEMVIAPPSQEPLDQTPLQPGENCFHWDTGGVAVQPHRSTSNEPNRPVSFLPDSPAISPLAEEHQKVDPVAVPDENMPSPVSQLLPEKEELIRTGESIRFLKPRFPSSEQEMSLGTLRDEGRPILSTAAAAVDVLFESLESVRRTEAQETVRPHEPRSRSRFRIKLARARIAMRVFFSSCFSTTRALVMSSVALLVLSSACVALSIGVVGLAWILMEERPSPAFQTLTTIPQRMLSDSKKNGYLLLLGFDAPAGQDPLQDGYERRPGGTDVAPAACLDRPNAAARASASTSVASGWFKQADPISQFQAHQDTVKGWASQSESALGRYRQWLKLPFEDWGYGQAESPPCASILFAHQLYVADAFVESGDAGIDRLETDMEAWRIVLAQAKTLSMKTMAIDAINNDVAVASGMLVSPNFDGRVLGRLTKLLRPLDQVELSIRWPMQNELVTASKSFEAQIKMNRNDELPLHAVVASTLPLPKQRRFNDYAAYYEASYKAAGEDRYHSLPKWSHYIHFPANTIADYLTNPIENLVGLEPLPAWDRYNGMVVDTDAYLRLASLQAWLRRSPQDADLLARIAKAGQSFYDPYTGLPMLVNLKKGVMYSVGHDGKDQDGDPQMDVVVLIPVSQSSSGPSKDSSSKSK